MQEEITGQEAADRAKKAAATLREYKALLEANMNIPWLTTNAGDQLSPLSERAALEFAAAFDASNEMGMCHAEHDKWLAMAQISGRGVTHAYEDAATLIALEEHIGMMDELVEMYQE